MSISSSSSKCVRSTRQPKVSFTSPPTNAAASTELNVCDGPERRPVTRYEGRGGGGGGVCVCVGGDGDASSDASLEVVGEDVDGWGEGGEAAAEGEEDRD